MFGRKLISQYETRLTEQGRLYEARISELKDQISRLEKLVFIQTSASNIPLISLEADAVLSQKEETIQISQEELERLSEIESEADRILAGNY